MAIKPKIPSQEEIKSYPQSFSEQELKELRELRSKLNQITAQLGQISINEIKIEEAKDKLKKELSILETQESNMAKILTDKYGKGSIDLDSGTFTPSE